MNKLKVAIIGCGGIANGKHMPAIKRTEQAEMVAFCDIIEERASKAAKDYGVQNAKVFTDYRDLLKLDLDAIYICTPNRSHSEISVAALESGKHVMCEKPMAINAIEAAKMTAAAKASGKILTIGYQSRYRGDSRYLKAECEAGELGEIYFAKAHALRRRAVPSWGSFLNEYEQGGGPLIDIGTHALDLTLWMMNNYSPKYVTGSAYYKFKNDPAPANAWGDGWKPEEFTVEDSAFGFITMQDGSAIILESSWALNTLDEGEAQTTLCGTKAGATMRDGLKIHGARHNKLYTTTPVFGAGGVAFYEGDGTSPEVLEQQTFFGAIRGENELIVLPEQAELVTKILDAIYESAKQGGKQIEV